MCGITKKDIFLCATPVMQSTLAENEESIERNKYPINPLSGLSLPKKRDYITSIQTNQMVVFSKKKIKNFFLCVWLSHCDGVHRLFLLEWRRKWMVLSSFSAEKSGIN